MPKKPVAGQRPRPRQAAKAASREALINAALELIPGKGLDVSLDELCAHAGYTRGAFYQHFRNRDALICAVMERVSQQVVDAVIESTEGVEKGDIATMIRRLAAILQQDDLPFSKTGQVPMHQLLEACARSPDVRQAYQSLLQNAMSQIATKIGEGQRCEWLRDDLDPQAFSTLLVALFVGMRTLNELALAQDLPCLLEPMLNMLRAGNPSPPASNN